ncbi:DNA-directed DNA polymerase alpha subunit pol12 [Tulasnella sp. 332]|nr:DNA-directed DNA polymerase alpha subunit pol12 [Tulasnella sp. 332]
MSQEVIQKELMELFGRSLETPEVMAACVTFCKTYAMSPEDLFYSWQSFTFNRKTDMGHFGSEQIPGFRDYINAELKNKVKQRTSTSTPARGSGAAPKTTKSAYGARVLAGATATPESALKSSLSRSVFPTDDVKPILPLNVSEGASRTGAPGKNIIVPASNISQFTYRYMYEKTIERANVLDSRIDEFGRYVSDFYSLTDDIADPNLATEEDVVVVGRICDATDSKLTESSLLLEPSRWAGSGRRIPLKFAPNVRCASQPSPDPQASAAPRTGIGLFPGAIAAFRGALAHGLEGPFFSVKEMLPLPPLKAPVLSKASGRSFTALVVSGPYTSDADMHFEPFKAVLSAVRQAKPEALILLGPFLDSNHPLIREGDIDQPIDNIFLSKIAAPLRDLVIKEQNNLSIAMMPSVRDMVTHKNVYPQGAGVGPTRYQIWNPPPHISPTSFLSNPGAFSIHGVNFGATTVDVLFHLRKQEVFKSAAGAESAPRDAMGELCRHILDQRSYYPVFPVPYDLSADVNLDVSHSQLLSIVDAAPDVIIVPSRLKEFAKASTLNVSAEDIIVDNTVFINPSAATKFNAPGMVARITVDAMKQGPERIAVDIVKL